jgi:hypothetical protein
MTTGRGSLSDTNLRPTLKHLLTVCPVPDASIPDSGSTRICVQLCPIASSENIHSRLFTIAWIGRFHDAIAELAANPILRMAFPNLSQFEML